ncbi:MAG TPA: hypothetical protein VKP67_21100 [Xanthobacteraceae bacterium]|nr:hypothetical protein [Xanthobacteraceae bacterium]
MRVDPVGLLPRRIVIGAGTITIGIGGVGDLISVVVVSVVNVAVGPAISVVVVAVDDIGIIGVISNIIGASFVEQSLDATDPLNVPDHRQDVALRPDVAAGGALEMAAQDGLDGRHRYGMAVLHHDGRAVGLV